jgi:hypothetical protein
VAETVGYDGARELVELARAAGVVVSGVGFPGRHADADDALRRAEARLDGVDRARWSACRRRIATDCEQLARALERTLDRDEQGADADAVLATNASVRAAVHALIAESGATDVKIPDSMLRVDLVAAFDIWIGRRDAVELLSVLADWARTERRGGGLQRHPRRVRRLLGRLAGVDLFARDHEPEIEDEKDATEGGASVAPPLGALVIRPTPSGTAWVRGVSDAPTATHARHAAALAERGDPLLPWFRARFDRLAADAGLEIVDLVADAPVSPNVCSRPEYVARCVRPWSVDDAGLGARARLVRGPHRGALLIDDAGRHRVAFAFTAATAPTRDPIVARLLATSFSPLADGPPSAVRDVAPSSATRDVARRTTDDGRVVVPARTMLSTTQCRGLATVRGAARFVMWRRLVRTHRWGAIVRVSRAHGEPMLVPTGSPLAIEALFEGFRGEPLVVHEVIDRGWSVDAAGARCVELVVPFARPGNPWRAVDADGGRCDEAAG